MKRPQELIQQLVSVFTLFLTIYVASFNFPNEISVASGKVLSTPHNIAKSLVQRFHVMADLNAD